MSSFLFFVGHDVLVAQGPDGASPLLSREGPAGRALDGLAAAVELRRDFTEGRAPCSALMLGEAQAEAALRLEPGLSRIALRDALGCAPAGDLGSLLKGAALLRWLETARFCGSCGSPLADEGPLSPHPGGRGCSACGRVFFPRISPAVILLIRKGPRALLAHNARFKAGSFGLIAGFVEAGETLEQAAEREAREEAGIGIRDLRYVKSQPWPFPDSLMVAFKAEWASGEARPDGVEISELRWCLPSELPSIPPKGSVARSLIDEFREGG
jgi:NAD+ diphosphatase